MTTIITKDIDTAAAALASGEIIGLPTETVYGLAGSAFRPAAVEGIYNLKERPRSNPLILHIAGLKDLDAVATGIPQSAYDLAAAFWPGPLTLVLPKQPTVSGVVTSGLETVAVRVPAHPMAQQLLAVAGCPVAAPSANPFGRISPTNARHVYGYFKGKIPLIVDGGSCAIGIESTIVGFENGFPVIYRHGAITHEQVAAIVGNAALETYETGVIKAPGMHSRHYSPRTPLVTSRDVKEIIAAHKGKQIGAVIFKAGGKLPVARQITLSPEGSLTQAAAGLYEALHAMDLMGLDLIVAEEFPACGIGAALNDKLYRASR
ncbi:threonylcarbamoyl-AMP synthase [Flavobacterium album]|uniref:Threonylcarbamoyl-AMP synthase n=1 Tax=Flavobacterium album TaxID=2175091 RepID=A0A2S1R1F6_9FLAO|nr:L-threonylcarbamoyladenylate synthase [Flavobacterium album]AWH86508.1 threonylcarbamoyl-AMP synthase [Flavobacterium album]